MKNIVEVFNVVEDALRKTKRDDKVAHVRALAQLAVASRKTEREARIKAIKVAGKLSDKIEDFLRKTLVKKMGVSDEDAGEALKKPLSALEDALTDVLTDHFEAELSDEKEEE